MNTRYRIDWRNALILGACFLGYFVTMELMGYWKMDVDDCADAIFKQMVATGFQTDDAELMALETCRNLKDAGIVR